MPSQPGKQLKIVTFRCSQQGCNSTFKSEPGRIEPDESQDHHPWRYLAICPSCGQEAEQIHWERSLLKAHANATGPKTPEGLAAVTKNLEGHPTLQESQLTRFNASKHGLYARVMKYFPARPGKYAACEDCPYMDNGCTELTKACMRRAEIFLRYQLAYDEKNPQLLRDMNMELQASLRGIVDDIIRSIVRRGVEWEVPKWYYDKDGDFHWAEGMNKDGDQVKLTEIVEHPLLKTLIDLLKSNGMTLPDDGMTLRSADQDAALKGYLEHREGDSEQALEYQRRSTVALENLSGLIDRSRERKQADPVLLEHQGEGEEPRQVESQK